jgi:hypothetical protein
MRRMQRAILVVTISYSRSIGWGFPFGACGILSARSNRLVRVCARLLLRSGGSSACLSPALPCPPWCLPFPALPCPSCLPARTPFAHLPVDQEPETTRLERVGPAPGPSSSPGPVPHPRQKFAIPRERNMPLIDCDLSGKIKSTRLR